MASPPSASPTPTSCSAASGATPSCGNACWSNRSKQPPWLNDRMDETATLDVRDNPANRTYEARIAGKIVGSLVYELRGIRTVLTPTWVEPSPREHGFAPALSQGALDALRA